jgi:hypothetical protein
MSRRSSVLPLTTATLRSAFAEVNVKTASKTWVAQEVLPANAGDFKSAVGAAFIVSRGAELFGGVFDPRAIEVHIQPSFEWCVLIGGTRFESPAVFANGVDRDVLVKLTSFDDLQLCLDSVDVLSTSVRKCIGAVKSATKGAERADELQATFESWSNTTAAVAKPDAVHKHGQPKYHIKGALSVFCAAALL